MTALIPTTPRPIPTAPPLNLIERLSRRILFRILSHLDDGQLTIIAGSETRSFGHGRPQITIEVNDSRLWLRLLLGRGRALAATYAEQLWTSDDVVGVIALAARNAHRFDGLRQRLAPVLVPYQRLSQWRQRNTPWQSRKDIAAHYDLGNDLFELMLDPTMSYSAVEFTHPETSLEQAALIKLEHICQQLDLGPDDHIVEIGTGWGGFAIYAAQTRGCHVTTTSISQEQVAEARRRVSQAGLDQLVEVRDQDYRELDGVYDKLVSVEMIEAVGWKDFDTFFTTCQRLLKADGVMFLQAITIDDQAYEVEKTNAHSFIREYIFPNGCLPSLAVITETIARRTDLQVVSLRDLTPHYVQTLHHWRANIDGATKHLTSLGYDAYFQRLWRLYLAYCEAGFSERRINSIQLVLARAGGPAKVK